MHVAHLGFFFTFIILYYILISFSIYFYELKNVPSYIFLALLLSIVRVAEVGLRLPPSGREGDRD